MNPVETMHEQEESTTSSQPPSYMMILDYFFLVLRRWPYTLFGLVVCLGAAGLVYVYSERVFESSCTVLVERYGAPFRDGAMVVGQAEDWLSTEARLITSDEVLSVAAETLNRQGITSATLVEELVVERFRNTSLLQIRFRSKDPHFAREALQSVADAYSRHFSMRARSIGMRRLEEMREEEPRLKQIMFEAEKKRLEEQKRLGFFSLDAPQEAANQRIRAVSENITSLRIQRAGTKARLDALRKFAGQHEPEALFLEFSEAESLRSLTSRYRALAEDLAAKELTFGPNHPQVEAVKARMVVTRRDMESAVKLLEESLDGKLDTIDRTIANMEELLREARSDASEAVEKATHLEELRRKEQHAKELYGPYKKMLGELDLSQNFQTGWVGVVDPPSEPEKPLWPSPLKLALAGVFMGLVLGVLLALTREGLDDSTKIAEDVLHIWRLPVLGFVPHLEAMFSLKDYEEVARSSRADIEALRMLAVSIDTILSREETADGRGKVVVFSSPGSKEGKTSLAFATGAMLAQGNRKVLLVDADLRRRGLTHLLDMSSCPGINSWFRHQDDVTKYIEKTPVEALDVLPAGRWREGPALMFRRGVLHVLLEDLSRRYDYVIVDVPPMSFVSDAITLAGSEVRMVVIARMGVTSKRLFRRSRDLADTTGMNVAGLIVNDYDARGVYYGYYYRYYGYYHPYKGYEYYYSSDSERGSEGSDEA